MITIVPTAEGVTAQMLHDSYRLLRSVEAFNRAHRRSNETVRVLQAVWDEAFQRYAATADVVHPAARPSPGPQQSFPVPPYPWPPTQPTPGASA